MTLVAIGASVTPGDRQGGLAAAEQPTVGDFITRYAQTMNLAQDPTQEEALALLRGAGLIGAEEIDLSAPVTEGLVVDVSVRSGLAISSRSPEKPISSRQMNRYFSAFGSKIAGGPQWGAFAAGENAVRPPNAADPRTKGRGKKKGLSPHFPF
ncbi:MAG TPA: hypothetical protein VFP98_04590 [Candidatus Polarisedimenticolia bacterium]|nr:hypothetical protein [Candidatus Polarisedimenticolia bacterium]